jgi:hypothetical protein
MSTIQYIPQIVTGSILLHEIDVRYFTDSEWTPSVFEAVGDVMPMILYYVSHAPSTNYAHPLHIFKTLAFSCILLGTRAKLLLGYVEHSNSLFRIDINAMGQSSRYTSDSLLNNFFGVDTMIIVSNMIPFLIYGILCSTDFSYWTGGALMLSVSQMIYIDYQRLPLIMERQAMYNIIRNEYDDEQNFQSGQNWSYVVRSWVSYLTSHIWTISQPDMPTPMSNANEELSRQLFTNIIYYNCFFPHVNMFENIIHFTNEINHFFGELNMVVNPGIWRHIPFKKWLKNMKKQTNARQERIVQHRVLMDTETLCRMYGPVLVNLTTFQEWANMLSPSMSVLIQKNRMWQASDAHIHDSYWRQHIPSPHISTNKHIQSNRLDRILSELYFKKFNLTLEWNTYPNLVWYMQDVPHPNWTNGTELIDNCIFFINLTWQYPILFEIISKDHSTLSKLTPPRNFLTQPHNSTFRWTVSSTHHLPMHTKFMLWFYTCLNKDILLDFEITDHTLNIDIPNIVQNYKENKIFFEPALYMNSIHLIMAANIMLPEVASHILEWLRGLEKGLYANVKTDMNNVNIDLLIQEYDALFTNSLHKIHYITFVEPCLIHYMSEHIVKHMTKSSLGNMGRWYTQTSKEIYIVQLENIFSILPDTFGNVYDSHNWKYWFMHGYSHSFSVDEYVEWWLTSTETIKKKIPANHFEGSSIFWHFLRHELVSNHLHIFLFLGESDRFNSLGESSKPFLSTIMPWASQNIFMLINNADCFIPSRKHQILKKLHKLNKTCFLSNFISLLLQDEEENELIDLLTLAKSIGVSTHDINDALDYILVILYPLNNTLQIIIQQKIGSVLINFYPDVNPFFLNKSF